MDFKDTCYFSSIHYGVVHQKILGRSSATHLVIGIGIRFLSVFCPLSLSIQPCPVAGANGPPRVLVGSTSVPLR